MTLLLNNNGYDNDGWQAELERQWPEVTVRRHGDVFDPTEITYALVWNHPPGDLQRYSGLKAIFSLGAGAEHLIADSSLPEVPVVLLADPAVARDMAAHALYWVLERHRRYADYRAQQSEKHWHRFAIPPGCEFRVGVLGLGRIGLEVATRIRSFDYAVSGWDAGERSIDGIETTSGANRLGSFLENQDLVINCLPLTHGTRHLLGQDAFDAMKPGAFFVNISRGAVVDNAALLVALNKCHLSGAALDAFAIEPLPMGDPFWSHPLVHVTPHMSGATFAASAVALIIENIRKLESGALPTPLLNRASGY
ncbi:2-hydroxyacid dehydrogenase [Granulosicoccus antarcticus]|uniref:Glyoxylate/hydroxypyruvate reductase A n=1 Tax=Granulosicoccus antarcticus IMCC3135 TaxID=1192854 RepID=A0A2Z2NRQ1_9GAMM|nr:glyoxylate/hydroxypyruvate reductase A [Granulosicoccus antarcticus]ASJ73185.1 Glyoxylate/hydroxypyruvate reductase A [Granulosicoccus antarcticus IMCC3135]